MDNSEKRSNSAMMWGWGKRIEEKEKEALQNDKLMK